MAYQVAVLDSLMCVIKHEVAEPPEMGGEPPVGPVPRSRRSQSIQLQRMPFARPSLMPLACGQVAQGCMSSINIRRLESWKSGKYSQAA